MARAGVFDEGDRLELLDGEIVQMNPVGRRHVATVNRLTRLFARVFGERVLISAQNPLVLDSGTEPQPDLVLAAPSRGRLRAFFAHRPGRVLGGRSRRQRSD